MKKLSALMTIIVILTTTTITKAAKPIFIAAKGPIVMEALTKHATVNEALSATKTILLKQQFIIQGEMGSSSFTAKRTTGAEADYYIADVAVAIVDGKAKVTITFVKIGTGLLKLQKVADEIKIELEK